jgi:hypothetical protein
LGLLILVFGAGYLLWTPGLEVRDGRHDRGRNGIWTSHGWLGADDWFARNNKTNEFAHSRRSKPRRSHTAGLVDISAGVLRQGIAEILVAMCAGR